MKICLNVKIFMELIEGKRFHRVTDLILIQGYFSHLDQRQRHNYHR